jgi:hypothetical protein
LDTRFGEGAGLGHVDEQGEGVEGFLQRGDGLGEGLQAGVAAYLADGAQHGHCA